MSLAPEFVQFVKDGDLIQARSYLANYLVVDKTFALFDEAYAFASKQLPILQEHDGTALEADETLWDEDYLNHQLVAVVSNFSKERIEHLKNVVVAVLGKEVSITETHPGTSRSNDDSTSRTGRTVISEHEIINHDRSTSEATRVRSSAAESRSSAFGMSHTGRRVVSETEIPNESKTSAASRHINNSSTTEPSSHTGRRVVSEVEIDKKSDEEPSHPASSGKLDIGAALIIGGVAMTAVGVAVVKPVVIGAGVAVAGVGVVAKFAGTNK